MPETLIYLKCFSWITERCLRVDRFKDASRNFQKIIWQYPDSTWAAKARLNVARATVTTLIISGKYNEAQDIINKMLIDFAGNPGLPGVIYWTTERFERLNRFEEAKRNYQLIMQQFPASPYANKAKLAISKVEAGSLIESKDYDKAKVFLDKMAVDFAANPDLPGTLYWITERYEKANKFDEAKSVYQQIVKNYPDNPYANKTRLGVRRVDVMALMESPDANLVENALNKMIVDFKDDPELPVAVAIIGEKCFTDAKTPDYGQRTIKVLERVMYELPQTQAMAGMNAEVYCCAGDCHREMGNYIKALTYYEKIIQDYYGHRLTGQAYFGIGQTYEKLIESGNINESEATLKIKDAYERLVREYPACRPGAEIAKQWLSEHNPK